MTQQTPEQQVAERFARDTAQHQMTVKHDDGLYRHLRFMQPKSSSYWFDLITWPGCLTIRGDIGTSYTFSRLPDMFEFFRGKRINPHYWAEKLDSGRSSAQAYSEDLFKQTVWMYVRDAVHDYQGLAKAVQEHFFGEQAEWNTEYEEEARAALDAFEYLPEGQRGEPFRFDDTWEWSLKDYGWQFVWACHAIQWGVGQYDAARRTAEQSVPAAVGREMTDTAPLTDQQLADIRQRAEAATPGPWHLDEDDAEIWSADHNMVADIWEPTHASRNGEFIAHARQDVPALLAEVNRLRAESENRRQHAAAAAASADVLQQQIDAQAQEIDRLRAELAKYVGHEPTIAEEKAELGRRLDAVDQLHKPVERGALTICDECSVKRREGPARFVLVPWPCATANAVNGDTAAPPA